MIEISQQHNEDRLNGTKANLERGISAPTIEVYTAPRPAAGAAVTTQVLLTIFSLPRPVGTVGANKLTIDTIPDALILETGTAAWARVLTGNGDFSMDCDVTDALGSGEVKMSQIDLLQGGVARMVSAEFG